MPTGGMASAKRRSARKPQPTAHRTASLEAALSSPSRPAKRRKTQRSSAATPVAAAHAASGATTPPPAPDPDPETEDNNDQEDDSLTEDTQSRTAEADSVIPVLREAKYTVLASLEYPQTDDSIVSAYAKIAGRKWTYYVKKSSISIGRAPDKWPANSEAGGSGGGGGGGSSGGVKTEAGSPSAATPDETDIDLGPSKLISRLHAVIFYDNDRWQVEVKGRNGVRVNEVLYRKGQLHPLKSGDIMEIGGTEMVFVSPDVTAVVEAKYLNRLQQPQPVEEEAEAPTSLSTHTASRLRHHSFPHGHPQPQLPPPAGYQKREHVSPYGPPANAQSQPSSEAAPQQQPARPTTPVNSLLSAPYLSQNAAAVSVYDQPMLMDTNDQIDYASDSTKHLKPPMSYATLIAQAILSTPEEKLSLSGIYDWIKSNFSYYRHIEQSWQNSIRHNLSLNKAFERKPREPHEPGKGMLWVIVDSRKEEFKKEGLKQTSRGGARQPSNPNTPVPRKSPKVKTPTVDTHGPPGSKMTPSTNSPPTYHRNDHDSQTPSRPPRGQAALGNDSHQKLPQLFDDGSPYRNRGTSHLTQNADTTTAAGSPPGNLGPSAYYDSSNTYQSIYTPIPQRQEPRLTAPSTAKLPSQYLPQSSPYPFWRDPPLGSTPAKPFVDSSPVKAPAKTRSMGAKSGGENNGGGERADDDDDDDDEDTRRNTIVLAPSTAREVDIKLQSSSPPPEEAVGSGSPTRMRPAPQMPVPVPDRHHHEQHHQHHQQHHQHPPAPAPPPAPLPAPRVNGVPRAPSIPRGRMRDPSPEEDVDGPLDILGNFPAIGEKPISSTTM